MFISGDDWWTNESGGVDIPWLIAAHVIGEACLDDALSGLESELEAKSGACPWHSETTGL